MRIRTKSALFILLCSIVPLAGTMFLAFDSARSALAERTNAELAAASDKGLEQVERFLDDARSDLAAWSRLHIVRDAITGDASGHGSGHVAAELRRLGRQYPHFSELLALNAAGTVVAAIGDASPGADYSASQAHAAASRGLGFESQVEVSSTTGEMAVVMAEPIPASVTGSCTHWYPPTRPTPAWQHCANGSCSSQAPSCWLRC